MKAITLTQPWATLVAMGAKRIETRSWSTKHRGLIAIHAAKGASNLGWARMNHICRRTEPFRSVLQLSDHPKLVLPLGAIIATAEIVEVHKTTEIADSIPRNELSFGDYSGGRFAWILENIKALKVPVPMMGALGLWECGIDSFEYC